MSTSQASEILQVVGLAASGAPGPALLGTAESSLLLAVSTADGTPVPGLQRDAFTVAALVARRGGTSNVPLVPAKVDEPMFGVYGLHFAPGTISRFMVRRIPCVVDVRAEGIQGVVRGRALVQLSA